MIIIIIIMFIIIIIIIISIIIVISIIMISVMIVMMTIMIMSFFLKGFRGAEQRPKERFEISESAKPQTPACCMLQCELNCLLESTSLDEASNRMPPTSGIHIKRGWCKGGGSEKHLEPERNAPGPPANTDAHAFCFSPGDLDGRQEVELALLVALGAGDLAEPEGGADQDVAPLERGEELDGLPRDLEALRGRPAPGGGEPPRKGRVCEASGDRAPTPRSPRTRLGPTRCPRGVWSPRGPHFGGRRLLSRQALQGLVPVRPKSYDADRVKEAGR